VCGVYILYSQALFLISTPPHFLALRFGFFCINLAFPGVDVSLPCKCAHAAAVLSGILPLDFAFCDQSISPGLRGVAACGLALYAPYHPARRLLRTGARHRSLSLSSIWWRGCSRWPPRSCAGPSVRSARRRNQVASKCHGRPPTPTSPHCRCPHPYPHPHPPLPPLSESRCKPSSIPLSKGQLTRYLLLPCARLPSSPIIPFPSIYSIPLIPLGSFTHHACATSPPYCQVLDHAKLSRLPLGLLLRPTWSEIVLRLSSLSPTRPHHSKACSFSCFRFLSPFYYLSSFARAIAAPSPLPLRGQWQSK